jgi:methylated-DNA-protein-cysteine methyltransferase related protein
LTYDYTLIYTLIKEVPKRQVASYGMIASLLPGVTARMVGRALSHLPRGEKAPWHRIVNSSGAIAARDGASRQRARLLSEGVAFRKNGHVDWSVHRWRGPSQRWIIENGYDPNDVMEIIAGWRR